MEPHSGNDRNRKKEPHTENIGIYKLRVNDQQRQHRIVHVAQRIHIIKNFCVTIRCTIQIAFMHVIYTAYAHDSENETLGFAEKVNGVFPQYINVRSCVYNLSMYVQ